MNFEGGQFYHIYNRSFNRNPVFVLRGNYEFFLQKFMSLNVYCEVLAYCLMPNHFHILIYVPENSSGLTRLTASSGLTGIQLLSRKIGTILSSYTQAFNKQENRSGSLFQPKTKAKKLSGNHAFTCFHYIHQNPLRANLVSGLGDWLHSSFNEYLNNEIGLCNKQLAFDLLDIPSKRTEFINQSNKVYDESYFF